MRVVLQRVKHASVHVDGTLVAEIQQGCLLLVGVHEDDSDDIIEKLARKCVELRIFEDEQEKMNKSLHDVKGSILSISQFTLYADCRKGRRPGFDKAAKGSIAKPIYERFNEALRRYGIHVETGVFGADMKVELLNDGPVTILLDSDEIC